MSSETRSAPGVNPGKLLGALRVKAENSQVKHINKIMYSLYPLLRLTVKLVSYRGDTEKKVQRVQKLIRFDKPAQEGG